MDFARGDVGPSEGPSIPTVASATSISPSLGIKYVKTLLLGDDSEAINSKFTFGLQCSMDRHEVPVPHPEANHVLQFIANVGEPQPGSPNRAHIATGTRNQLRGHNQRSEGCPAEFSHHSICMPLHTIQLGWTSRRTSGSRLPMFARRRNFFCSSIRPTRDSLAEIPTKMPLLRGACI